jgi:hypothetical protein
VQPRKEEGKIVNRSIAVFLSALAAFTYGSLGIAVMCFGNLSLLPGTERSAPNALLSLVSAGIYAAIGMGLFSIAVAISVITFRLAREKETETTTSGEG